MRQDVLTGEWVSIAAARQNRVHLPPSIADPLAPATADKVAEIPSNYDVAVFENRSPSFGPALDAGFGLEELGGVGLGRSYPSIGLGMAGRFLANVATLDQMWAISLSLSKCVWAGSQLRDSRDRALIFAATSAKRSGLWRFRLVPLGKCWRMSPLAFSFEPRCQGECGSQK